jgi:hypothetical protein
LLAAKDLLAQAERLDPGANDLEVFRRAVETSATQCIGGGWHKFASTDAMTDDLNVTVILNSDNEVADDFKSWRGKRGRPVRRDEARALLLNRRDAR